MLECIVALAGRRFDAPGAVPARFPPANAGLVRRRLADLLATEKVGALVSSAACGADLIALELAIERGLDVRVILPSSASAFRRASVTDRDPASGPSFDAVVEWARRRDALVELPGYENPDYGAVTAMILADAKAIPARRKVAIAVWERESRGSGDWTAHFAALAVAERFALRTVSTRD
jgi:hypothetical protein